MSLYLREGLYLREDFAEAVAAGALKVGDGEHCGLFEALAAVEGEVYRRSARRSTSRVVIDGAAYFVKVHDGVGWWEIAKNLLVGKRPVLGARHEYEASRRLHAEGVAVPGVVAFGEKGLSPARRRSFAVSDALDGFVSLEEIGNRWGANPGEVALKHRLVSAIAGLTAAMHAAGVCHRDYYACHLMLNAAAMKRGEIDLAVIDLHRAEVHGRLSDRARLRDIAALLYSTSAMPLTERDRLRFVGAYAGALPATELRRHPRFWAAVRRRAKRLHHRARARGLVTGPGTLVGVDVPSIGRLADLGRNPPVPFRFDVDLGAGAVRAVCTAVLRAQPGRRLVLRARVAGREVVLKAFFGRRGRRDSTRERRGIEALQLAEVATPAVLGIGRGGSAHVLAFELLDDAHSPSADDVALLLAVLARMHGYGIRQRDLHVDNFLVARGQAFAIDGERVDSSGIVNDSQRRDDIARLLAHYSTEELPPVVQLAKSYQTAAGKALPRRGVRDLARRAARARRRRVRKFIAKTVRECTAFVVRAEAGRRVIAARDDDEPQLRAIIADPERALATGERLKRGSTTVATRVGDLVVRRYTAKGRWHRLVLRLRPGRARRAWQAGHGLRLAGLATPRPRALIEMSRPGIGEAAAYLVLDHVEGESLAGAVEAACSGIGLDADLSAALAKVFGAWRELRFGLGDTRPGNFVVSAGQVHVLDLDRAVFCRGAWRFGRHHRRDRERFLRNWLEVPVWLREAVAPTLDGRSADEGVRR